VDRRELKAEGWVLLSPIRHEIFSALEAKDGLVLKDIAESYQGIITGCDKAFIVSRDEIHKHELEEALLRPWIKNSDVLKHNLKTAEKFLMYSDFIKEEKDFPNAIRYIEKYRHRLEERRECKRGVRKWYQLQWGRTNEIFETPKIVYPYKSRDSRFTVDRAGSYCSADVYMLKLKKEYESSVTLDYVAAILSSKLFEFYFKCYAKRISVNLYDYYPNTVLRMKIPRPTAEYPIQEMVCALAACKNEECKRTATYEIDREVYKLYGLNKKQIEIVENTLF
jgi:adenine-specific DNA-methyltransferase